MTGEIWLLLDSSKPGGIETHVLQLAKALANKKRAVRAVFIKDHGKHPLKRQLKTNGIQYACLNGSFTQLLDAMRKELPSIVHTHGYKAGLMGRFASFLLGTKVLSTYHAGETTTGRLALYDWLDRHTAWLASNSFAVSDAILSRVPGCDGVIDNFIDTRNLQPSSGQQIAFVGRLSKEKAPERFLRIARLLPRQQFHVYGDGPLLQTLKSQAPKNLFFHGHQANMNAVWPNIGLLVMPSKFEGLPMTALEAMGRKIPLVATRVGGLPKLIENNKDGWLVSDEKSMLEKIQEWVLQNEEQREPIKLGAMQKIYRQYGSDIILPKLLKYY